MESIPNYNLVARALTALGVPNMISEKIAAAAYLLFILGFFYLLCRSIFVHKNKESVPPPLISQTASGNSSSTVSQVANVNQIAKTYTWTNRNNLSIQDYSDGIYGVSLEFKADSEIPPSNVCLTVSSDAEFDSKNPIVKSGVTMGQALSSLPMEDGLYAMSYCYNTPTVNEVFDLQFKSIPSVIKANLSKPQ